MAFTDTNDHAEVAAAENGASSDEDDAPELDDQLSVGGDDFSTASIDEDDIHDIYGNCAASRDQDSGDDMSSNGAENEVENEQNQSDVEDDTQVDEYDEDDEIYWKQPRPKNTSIIHHILAKNKLVFISFDIETGGEYCGIIQLSAQIIRMTCNNVDGTDGDWLFKQSNNKSFTTTRGPTFDKFVYPGEKAIWNEHLTTNVHGLHEEHEEIKRAKLNGQNITKVWNDFCRWVDGNTQHDEIATIVAYNGETCDLRWIWRHTQAPNSPGRFPSKIKFFMDPLNVINGYTTCKLNKKQSNLESFELGFVWRFLHPEPTPYPGDLHNSLTDVKIQSDLFAHKIFAPHINRSKSVKDIGDIFSAADRKDMEKEMEALRCVHHPWKEITPESNVEWTPSRNDDYGGPEGGPKAGPSHQWYCTRRQDGSRIR